MVDLRHGGFGFRALRREPLAFLREAVARGDLVRIGAAFSSIFFVNHPALIGRILRENHTNYRKGRAAARVRPLFGDGLTTADGETWQEHRRLLQPLFQSERVHAFSPIVADAAAEVADRWRDLVETGRPADISAEMLALTRRVILRVLFGDVDAAHAGLLGAAMDDALREINRRVWSALPMPLWVPTPTNRRLCRALQILQGFIRARMADVHPPRRDPCPLLDTLHDLTNDRSHPRWIPDETMTLLFAGHTTAAAALAWTWLLLDAHPDAEHLLAAELRGLPEGHPVSVSDLPMLPYARRLIDEVLRLYPPTWITGRVAVAEDWLDGQSIPAGAIVLLSPWAMHRHPLFWPEPERFDPQRFSPAERARRPAYTYLPFGAGPRVCIGQGFAVMEMLLALATLARRYRVRLLSPAPVVPEPAIVLRPPAGTLVRIEPREHETPGDSAASGHA